jgi:hypothetical protein
MVGETLPSGLSDDGIVGLGPCLKLPGIPCYRLEMKRAVISELKI